MNCAMRKRQPAPSSGIGDSASTRIGGVASPVPVVAPSAPDAAMSKRAERRDDAGHDQPQPPGRQVVPAARWTACTISRDDAAITPTANCRIGSAPAGATHVRPRRRRHDVHDDRERAGRRRASTAARRRLAAATITRDASSARVAHRSRCGIGASSSGAAHRSGRPRRAARSPCRCTS